MIDDYTKRGMILRSALRLAAEKGWKDLSLAEIARDAGASLAELHRDYGSKADILRAFVRDVDKEMLKRAAEPDAEAPARDRLLDVAMTRFEILEPYRAALKRIACDIRKSPDVSDTLLACASLRSSRWMLEAAGISPDGAMGAVRTAGMAALYARVAKVWLDDDTPDGARTMAALDRELACGERWLGRLNAACRSGCRIACRVFPGFRRRGGDAASGAAAG